MSKLTGAKLVYFDGRGRGEVCRWTLLHAGIEFEDYRLKKGEWGATYKSKSPTSMAPFLEFGDKTLASSQAIIAYIGKNYGMMGSDVWEEAQVLMCMDVVIDTVSALAKFVLCKQDEEKEILKKSYSDLALPRLLKFISNQLQGERTWLVGDKLSVADIAAAQFLYDHGEQEHKDIIEADVTATNLIKSITQQDSIRRWLQMRPESYF